MTNLRKVIDDIADDQESIMLTADGLDHCIVGVANQDDPVFVYSMKKVISHFVVHDGMSEEEAIEFFDFNVSGYKGEGTPIFMWDLEPKYVMRAPNELQ